jgi:hypothetical protein
MNRVRFTSGSAFRALRELILDNMMNQPVLRTVWQDAIDAAAFAVWARIQAGQPLTLALCREVITELDSTARANEVFYLVRQWRSEVSRTRRLGGR